MAAGQETVFSDFAFAGGLLTAFRLQ